MTENEYAEIARACDRLLRAPDTSLARVAIPLLHMVNEHPGWIARYAALSQSTPTADDWRTKWPVLDRPRAALRVGRGLVRSLWSGAQDLNRIRGSGSADVLIVSHLANPQFAHLEDDFYFGALQQTLLARGLKTVLVHVDHLTGAAAQSLRSSRQSAATRVLLPRNVAPGEEARIWMQCADASWNLRQAAHEQRGTLDAGIAVLASSDALSAVTARNLRLHASLAQVCEKLEPRIVITTHEGDACERIIWHAARHGGRRPLCVGYQHARLLARAHAIRRPVNAPGIHCDPEVILTLGEVSHATLAASCELGAVRLIRYGSHRRIEAPASASAVNAERRDLCLVLADTDERECSLLFEFALECARRTPRMMFSLRPHPAVGIDTLRSRQPALRRLPNNVTLSARNPLAEECSRARYCLYRGSSAAMLAVLSGVKPFYVSRMGELPFDPLFALPTWRETVSSPDEFAAQVEGAAATFDSVAARDAWNYCDRTVAPVRPEAIDELLAMAFL